MKALPSPGASVDLVIESDAGALQAILSMPRDAAPRGVVVVCHPHPLYGGSMQNKVVTTLAQSAGEAGCAALRFNFRGVGDSEGIHDGGKGEVDDVLAALAEAAEWLPGQPLLLAGFSFGGAMAVRAAERHAVAQLTTIAPALNYWGGERVTGPACPWLLIHGDADDVVDCDDTLRRAREAQQPPDIHVLPGVGHFFHGQLKPLRDLVTPALVAAIEN